MQSMVEYLESFETLSEANALSDKNGLILRINEPYERLFGWPASEIVGVQSADIKPIPPEDREQALLFVQMLLSGQSILNHRALRDTKGGSKISVSLDFIPLAGDDGEVAGWKTVARTIE